MALPLNDGHSFLLAGGLALGGASSSSVVSVTATGSRAGSAATVGSLAAPLHDAAAVALGGKGIVFGGGSAAPAAGNESIGPLPAPQGSTNVHATSLPPLPQARADESAVVVGSTAYVIGGYSGPSADAGVLATTDGLHYRQVAVLPVPVRYAAVTAVGNDILVFGGDLASGPHTGAPTATIQQIDTKTGKVRIAGSLPQPVAGAVAATLAGTAYVAGGEVARAGGASATVSPSSTVWAWSTRLHRALEAGHLAVAVTHPALAVIAGRAWIAGGEVAGGQPTADVQMLEPNAGFGLAGSPGAGSPYYGDKLLVADRGNNRLLLIDDQGRVVWQYPSAHAPPPPGGFYFPDDAFFARHGSEIISNQEGNETVVQLAFPSGKVLWQYGHPKVAGSEPGYLSNPDDAYLLRDGNIAVADPKNCRVVVISQAKKVLAQLGTPGSCVHSPPSLLGSPNGDTPLADGNLLVSEINGSWIDEYTLTGKLLWSAQLPITYPSDPQPLPGRSGAYVVADYTNPGAILEFDRSGHVLLRYGPASGPGQLDQPSLAEMLPSGVLMANDDYNDRMVAIDPVTGAMVWQYGHDHVPGTAAGYLRIPDGFDLLGPHGTTPTHPFSG